MRDVDAARRNAAHLRGEFRLRRRGGNAHPAAVFHTQLARILFADLHQGLGLDTGDLGEVRAQATHAVVAPGTAGHEHGIACLVHTIQGADVHILGISGHAVFRKQARADLQLAGRSGEPGLAIGAQGAAFVLTVCALCHALADDEIPREGNGGGKQPIPQLFGGAGQSLAHAQAPRQLAHDQAVLAGLSHRVD